MPRLLRLHECGVEVVDREGEMVQPLSDLVGCVERAALVVVVSSRVLAPSPSQTSSTTVPFAASIEFRPRTFIPRRVV